MRKLTDSELLDELQKRFRENEKTLNALKTVNNKIVQVNRKLQESEALKSNFLSNIRNEIVNPLTSILCIAKVLTDRDALDPETVPSMAESIYSEAFSLDFQLKNIFAAAELEAGEAAPGISHTDINTLVNGTLDVFIHRARAKNITLNFISGAEPEEAGSFMTDPEKLQLALSNLLSNAIEFSHEGGEVEVRAWRHEGLLHISVEDHGIGIDEADQGVIFDRFRQLDTGVAKNHPGHGLGASVTKAVVELLDGTVSVSSEKDRGSIFTISIPEAAGGMAADIFSGESNEFFYEVEEEQEF